MSSDGLTLDQMQANHDRRNASLKTLIEAQKLVTYVDPAMAEDANTLGIMVAHYVDWDGQAIFEAFSSALEDANFHAFNAAMRELWMRLEEQSS